MVPKFWPQRQARTSRMWMWLTSRPVMYVLAARFNPTFLGESRVAAFSLFFAALLVGRQISSVAPAPQ